MTQYTAQQALELIKKIHRQDPLSEEEQRYFLNHYHEHYDRYRSRSDMDDVDRFLAATDVCHTFTIDDVRYAGNALVNTTLCSEIIAYRIEERLKAGESLEDILASVKQ